MKNPIIIFILLFAIFFTACNKMEDEKINEDTSQKSEVIFTGNTVADDLIKSGQDSDEMAEYALITINGVDYMRNVFYLDGVPYTQSIKLDPGIYTVEKFLMKDDNQTPNDTTDDPILFATPEFGSEYAQYVSKPVPFDIEVEAFKKRQVPIEVLYFEPAWWESFGFDWFIIEQSYIREQCFFGDLCTLDPDEYLNSLYAGQTNGLQIDMPAIFYIDVWRDTEKDPDEDYVLTGTFSNEEWLGEGQPLCINYQDYLMYEDLFKFDLYMYMATENGFEYVLLHTWEFADDEMIESGDDGITDFVLGDCVPDADFIFDPPLTGGNGNTETAYAYNGDENGGCFIDLQYGNNWGWEIGPIDSDGEFELWAAAGGCDLNAGTHVGTVTVNFDENGNTVDVEYLMFTGYYLEEAHLNISSTLWQGNSIAPGQFDYKEDNLNGISSYTFDNKSDEGGTIYIIAHATVSGF